MHKNRIFILTIIFCAALFLSLFSIRFLQGARTQNITSNSVIPQDLQDETPTPLQTVVILGGDVMLGRNVMGTSIDKNDPVYPFRKISSFLNAADVVFVNLENPIIENCPRHDGGFKFCASKDMTEGLVFSGINVVNLANNHSLNYGREGLRETVEILDEVDILSTGMGNLAIYEVNNTKFGFLGFDYVSNVPGPDDLELIRESDPLVDVLIVGVHWGEEYKAIANSFQRKHALQFVDAGADIISGHHPHWVQDKELVDGKPVYYSLGNLVFDQMWSEETKKGLLVRLTFEENNLVREEYINTYMSSWAQPEIVHAKDL